ncbi:hypothetical protein FQN54_008415 [Arachnomyces sp. PD_36]|nr:hypothetical protein FQN54_008415 [Arachnomyces sp. PD_36]
MIQSLPYQDLVDLSLFEGPVADESHLSTSSITDIKPSPRIEITSWDGEPAPCSGDRPTVSATCLAGPMEFDYHYASFYQPSTKKESEFGPQPGFVPKLRRNNRKFQARDNSRDRATQTTDCLPAPSHTFTRSASDPCLNGHRSGAGGGQLTWCPERESWLYTYPCTTIERPSTANFDGREGLRGGPDSFLREYYSDGLTVEDPPPPYENHKSDAKTTTTTRNESQWSRIAQRVCRSPR